MAEPSDGPIEQVATIAEDADHLVDLHVKLLRAEVGRSAGQVAPALGSLGAGAGLAAVGGLLGTLMLVHGLHRATRLPLWGCYGVVGGLMGAAGVGLIGAGSRKLRSVDLVPHQTIATLKEDLRWIKDRTK